MATTETKTFKNFIGGEWVEAASGETFESKSPATGEIIGVFPKSGPEDADRAVAAAEEAYEEWRPRAAPQSGGDVQEAIDMSYYMAGEGRRLFGQTTPSELRDKFNMSVRMPIGVVGAITPWNFPIAIPSWKLAPALVCGNTVVFKPASDTPLLGERFVELLAEAGLPPGVVNIVHGGGGDVGPVINKGALEKIHSYTQIGQDEGARLLTGGEVASGDGLGRGFYYRPTIFGDVEAGVRVAQGGIFGPPTALIPVRDFDEAVRAANSVRYGLSSSIFTRDVNRAFRAMRDLQSGITYVNAGTIGAEVHLPFGGTKDTGNGHREAGQAALDVFTEWKALYVDYSGRLQRAQIDNIVHPAP